MEDGTQHLGHCMVDMKELSANPEGLSAAGVILTPKLPQVEFSLACNDLVASGRDRKPNALVQVAVIDPHKQHLVSHACTEIVEANKDPLFLTGVTFPSEYPASPETLVKLTVYDAKDKNQESVSSQLRPLALSFGGKGYADFDEYLNMAARPLAPIPWEHQSGHQWELEREPDIESRMGWAL
ncbi:type II inositol 3,4-bisphosphate 4-phosphatase-like [Stegastes partitus]|uniref:Type II inositol 3,4-bisphosphate 4-phosphatase-like n=1 Tax=Stegastes partitus TaxID=144197 RepID=A0A9Y4TWA4_9TELE|nr:PREDICTED: type II inositol 3,4-bisphosphate 4-phosphatase-like [Stegastes partitus]